MKLLIILCIEEMRETVAHLLHDAGVDCMGVTSFTGYRKSPQCSALGWFGRGSACEHASSLLMFTFTEELLAQKAIDLIDAYNAAHVSHFPLRGYVLEVSQFTKLMQQV